MDLQISLYIEIEIYRHTDIDIDLLMILFLWRTLSTTLTLEQSGFNGALRYSKEQACDPPEVKKLSRSAQPIKDNHKGR